MDEALFVVLMRGGGFLYKKTVIGRTAVNEFVNGMKNENPVTTFTVTIAAYEYLGTETTTI